MDKQAGIGYIEMIVVIAIIAILAGVTMVRLVPTKRTNELEGAANLVQSAVVEAREKAYSPKPSVLVDQPSDIYGYGVKLKLDSGANQEFSLFKDKVNTGTPSNQGKWSAEDEILTTYKFLDSNISNVIFKKFIKDGIDDTNLGDRSIVFQTSELTSTRKIYFDGVSSFSTVSIVLQNAQDISQTKRVTINFKSGEAKVE